MSASPPPAIGHRSAVAKAPPRRTGPVASLGAVFAAFLASLCCVGPLVFVTLGVGAGLATRFEPLRPAFTVLTLGLLAVGFYTVYGRTRATDAEPDAGESCGPERACAVPRHSTRDRVLLWSATVAAVLLLTFPQWSLLFI